MNPKYPFLLLLWLLVISGSSYAQHSTKGKDFWLGFMYNLVSDAPLEIYVTAEKNVTGVATIPGTGFSQAFTVAANTSVLIAIPNSAMAADASDGIEAKSIHVVTCDTVSVYAINKGSASDDATVVYPTPSLGNEYRVLTKTGNPGDWGKEFLIVASANNTSLQIIPSVATDGGKPAGVSYTVTLNQGDMYQVTSANDLTGTTIKGAGTGQVCKNFAVFSGSKCLNIGGCTACDHIYEQLMPIKAWGKEYILGKFAQKKDLIFRVLADVNATSFTINGGAPINLNAGQFYEFSSAAAAFNLAYVIANKPIMVMQYMAGADCDGNKGDPDQVLITPIEQNIQQATFYAIPSAIVTNFYVNIVTTTTNVATVQLDGANIAASFTVVPSNPLFSYAQVSITQATHQLKTPGGFAAFVYGLGPYESYSYSVGSSIKDLLADFTIFKHNEPACPGTQIDFTAILDPNTTSYNWNFGDGSPTAAGITVTHSYSAVGNYSVSLTKTQSNSCNVEIIKYISVPGSKIKVSGNDSICAGQSSLLTVPSTGSTVSLKSLTPCGDTLYTVSTVSSDSIVWSTGAINTNSISVSPGVTTTYYVWGYSTGAACVAMDSITVHVSKPQAGFTFTSVCQGLPSSFTNQSIPIAPSSNSVTTLQWDFTNDGNIDNSTANPTFTFPASGTFTTALIATDANGCRDTIRKAVTVFGHAVPSFTVSNACFNDANSFTSTSTTTLNPNTGSINAFFYQFGDGSTSVIQNPSHTYTAASNASVNTVYNASLTVTTPNGCKDSVVVPVNVYALPVADFSSDSVCLGLPSHIVSNATGNGNAISAYSWDLTNDNLADINGPANINYTFVNAGNSPVTVTVTTSPAAGLSCKSFTSHAVWVHPLPQAAFTFTNACINTPPLQFDASSSSIAVGTNSVFAWNFGDATVANGAQTTHTYAVAMAYNVTLTVTSGKGCQGSAIHLAEAYEKPIMSIQASSLTCLGSSSTFTAMSLPNSGTATTWLWDMNNSITSIETNGQSVSYVFPAAGTQTLHLVTITNHFCRDTTSRTVYINYIPAPQFTVDIPSGCPLPHCVSFTDMSASVPLPAKITKWQWTFGDGKSVTANTNTAQQNCYTNSSSSQSAFFTVSLNTTTDSGCVNSITKPNVITVYPKPVANYMVVPDFGNVVEPLVHFINQSAGYTKWQWSFGDGPHLDSVNLNPDHYYTSTSAESYHSVLIVANQYNCTDTAYILVDIKPEFIFYIPNAFTPNGDDLNDVFTGMGIGIDTYEMWIYDRWGAAVYHTNDIHNGWNGKTKNNDIKQDVYTWKVKLKDVFGKDHAYVGHVTLLN